jgi:DivIVA domain-containing protein
MELNPQAVSSATFRITKRGYDPDEVRSYLGEVARALENAQNHATAMEARARAAVAKSQEMRAATPASVTAPVVQPDDAETISKTLLLAQRTADATRAEARAEAEGLVASARAEADGVVAEARTRAHRMVDEARVEARRASESDRIDAENEVRALRARIDFLRADVAALERHARLHRDRLAGAAEELRRIAEQPEGLAELNRPVLSAAATDESHSPAHVAAPAPAPAHTPAPVPAAATPAPSPSPSPFVPDAPAVEGGPAATGGGPASTPETPSDTTELPLVILTDDDELDDASGAGVGSTNVGTTAPSAAATAPSAGAPTGDPLAGVAFDPGTGAHGAAPSVSPSPSAHPATDTWRPESPAPWMRELQEERSRTVGERPAVPELPFGDDDLPPPALRDITPSGTTASVASADPTPPVIEVSDDATEELPRYRPAGGPLRIIDDEPRR